MFGAIYIGLSGLNAYSRGLQQVSNNVTNLNTQGFRGSTVAFDNYNSSGDNGGLSYTVGSEGSGGGVGMGETRLDMRQGELRQTDRDLDLAIDGNGFLVLLNGEETLYTRTGSFEVDKDGFIVLAGTDYRLATLDAAGHPVSLSLEGSRTSAPKATTIIKMADNLSADATTFTVRDVKVHDSSGGAHVWSLKFDRDAAATGSQWKLTITDEKGVTLPEQLVKFNPGGMIDPTTASLSIAAGAGLSVTLDMSSVTSFVAGTVTTLRAAAVDGWGVGTLTAIATNAKGEIELGYSNEQTSVLGAVAIADFRDPEGIEQRSGGLFSYEGVSNEFLASGDPRVGQVMSGRLEASNVDLSKQFGDLILIQRGFQASSQIVSVSNDMIQQLFGIRGQG